MKGLVLLVLACAVPIAASASDAPSFDARVAAAKRAETEPVSRVYLERILIPAMEGAPMKDRVRDCLKVPGASTKDFTMVGTISSGGAVVDIDYRPSTNTGQCLAAAVRALGPLSRPPAQYEAGLPFYIDWNLSK